MNVGDAVLVQNDFSTPEMWPFPAIIVSIDEDEPKMADVQPLSDMVSEGNVTPVFLNQCKPLVKGKACESYLDAPNQEVTAYLDPDTKKVYFVPPTGEPVSFLEQEAWFETESGERFDLDQFVMIGDLEYQDED